MALPDPAEADPAGRVLVELARFLAGRLVEASDARAAPLAGRLAGALDQLERRSRPSGPRRPSRLELMRQARASADARKGTGA